MKKIYKNEEIKSRILSGVNKLAEPIVQTLTPRGANVIFQKGNRFRYTNDGKTIAQEIFLEDPVEDAVAQIVKEASLKTDHEAGDGTTTTVSLARAFLVEGMKLLDFGWSPIELKRELDRVGEVIVDAIDSMARTVEDDDELMNIALVSSSNDREIAENVVDAVKTAGSDGQVFVDENNKNETEIRKENGFLIEQGMFSPLLSNVKNYHQAQYKDVKVLVTDKKIYKPDEAISILQAAAEAGHSKVVVVAKDIVGLAPNIFISNHKQERMQILLVKEEDEQALEDLSQYLGCPLVSEKSGKLTFDVTIDDFGNATKVFSNHEKTYIYADNNLTASYRATELRERIEETKDEKEKKALEKRLANMTTGTATILVGGRTPSEAQEKIYRYIDAVSATRSANEDGYVPGGGTTLYRAVNSVDTLSRYPEVVKLFRAVAEEPLRQIATNCDINDKELIAKVDEGLGYNAVTGTYEDLEEAGIIDPLRVAKLTFENSLSVASVILSSRFLITDEEEDDD